MRPAESYSYELRLPVAREAVFALFADPRRLDSLTPSWFRLRPTTSVPRTLQAGSEMSYSLWWRGVPFRWTSVLTDWREPHFFAYEQKRGPYLYFRHEHHFDRVDGGTRVRDRVHFRSPGGSLADRLVAKPDLRRIFACREQRALAIFQADRDRATAPRATTPPSWNNA